ncbi:Fic family protein [Candidatus Kaiserbacteria bacterium]|nr:Fic family protein [Candidatus Kaiserbacteria bacterium]
MTVKQKLELIQKLSGLTQAQMAARLGVTFAALNRWMNEKAAPRKRAHERIDTLYREYSGEKQIPANVLEAKMEVLENKRREHRNILKTILENPDIRDQLYLSLTYNSNRIEGSTLSEDDTAAILFENAALPNKSLVEHLEAKNHKAALEYLFSFLAERKSIDEKFILKLHGILMNAIRPDAGVYRAHGVRIMGTHVPTANHIMIPALMRKLVRDINRKTEDDIAHIARVHSRFEMIHPFGDGNGRTGRLLMHAMALRADRAPVVILQEKRRLYSAYLNKAQMKNDLSLLEDFVCDAVLEGYRIVGRE